MELTPIFIVFIVFGSIVAVIVGPSYLKSRERTEMQLTVRHAVDKGQTLLVILKGPEPVRNVPRTAREQGHEVLSMETDSDGVTRLLLPHVAADINTAAALAAMFDLVRGLNAAMDARQVGQGDAAVKFDDLAGYGQGLGVAANRFLRDRQQAGEFGDGKATVLANEAKNLTVAGSGAAHVGIISKISQKQLSDSDFSPVLTVKPVIPTKCNRRR